MYLSRCVAAVVVCSVSAVCWAGSYVVPTTTLAAQIDNNTSAANTFAFQSNGNLGSGNVSKVNVHSLLYAGQSTKVLAHMMLWFGQSNHMNVGYSSNDPAQVHRQVTDMISRGINGVIIDWYGPNNFIDQATQLVMAEAEKHPGFTFAIMVDQGAIKWDSCSGCTPQQALISQLQYIEQKYFPSPAYMRIGGQPVVTNFNIDLAYSIDWNAANAALSTHPQFLFQNNPGFTHTLTDGSYSWVMPTTTDFGMSYLTSFYDTGLSYPSEHTVGAGYKGFNDTLAAWGSNRIMAQQCGQTWLQTFARVNSLYNAGKQLPFLQLVTWNDYEEGTEIESGIDNCFSLSGSVSGGGLNWTVGGSESVVDHYVVYISSDGQGLMALAHPAVGNRSLNLCSFPIPTGSYKLFVQAVGKPSLANRITGPIAYSPSCAKAAGVSLDVFPPAETVQLGRSGNFTVTAAANAGSFDTPISLSCTNLPLNLSCAFVPVAITPNAGSATSALTISSIEVVGEGARQKWQRSSAWWLPVGFAGLVLAGAGRRRREFGRALTVVCVAGVSLMLMSCGGPGSSGGVSAGNMYSVVVNGSSGSVELATTVTVTIP